jgi:hypothetical protein
MDIEKPGQHIDHMLKQTRAHHMQLSQMADMKANILLTMSSVVLTIAISYLNDPMLRAGSLTLMAFCLLTISLATYVVMPHITIKGDHPEIKDIKGKGFNLLFFGDFSRLTFEEYETNMEQVLRDHSYNYYSQIREIYQLGTFLAKKKYRLLRWAYLSFIAGFVCCAIVFAVQVILM